MRLCKGMGTDCIDIFLFSSLPQEVQFPDECWQKVLGLSAKKSGLPGFVVDATDNSELMGVEVWAGCVAKEGGAALGR
jgi:hypothetical protein